jgi:AcrR family transcriptional regulator
VNDCSGKGFIMANYPKFDREEVLQKAMNLYWEKGFNATSMRNLQDVVNLKAGSIYATFGSKEELYKEALNYYADTFVEMMNDIASSSESAHQALIAITKKSVLESAETAPSGICMLTKTISELTDENSDLLEEAQRLLEKSEQAMALIFRQALERNELVSQLSANELAKHLQIQIIGMRSYLKGSGDKQGMERNIDKMFSQYPFNFEV